PDATDLLERITKETIRSRRAACDVEPRHRTKAAAPKAPRAREGRPPQDAVPFDSVARAAHAAHRGQRLHSGRAAPHAARRGAERHHDRLAAGGDASLGDTRARAASGAPTRPPGG